MKTHPACFARFAAISLLVLGGTAVTLNGQSNYATPYKFTTFAGDATGGAGYVDGTGTAARFKTPLGISLDGAGNIYVADGQNHVIRKITPGGVVTTFAGTGGSTGIADGTGAAARFNTCYGVVVDSAGTVYVADSGNDTVRKITPGGVVTTFAGSPNMIGSVDGTGAAARFNFPIGLAVDGADNVYVADWGNTAIRKITPGGVVTTIAGYADGIYYPYGVGVDTAGDVYVANTGDNTIQKISAGGGVTLFAGTPATAGSDDGTGAAARFRLPTGVVADAAGNIYVADNDNGLIRKITPAGVVTTVVGSTQSRGNVDGVGAVARFNAPGGLTLDDTGSLYVADVGSSTIRKINLSTVEVTTLAGKSGPQGANDGTGSTARFNTPRGIAVDAAGNVYLADSSNSTLRKITPGGEVTTLAGMARMAGSSDGTGSAARFWNPDGIALDSGGNLFIADTSNNTVRKMTPGGVVSTFAGTAGSNGSTDGAGSIARFDYPTGVAVVGTTVYVADTHNHTIRKITGSGLVTTLAGTAGLQGGADGTGAAAQFYQPTGLAADASGNLYVGDSGNATIRKVTPAGVVTTLAGSAGNLGSVDGMGAAARFAAPFAVAVDGLANVYVADANYTIRRITPAGVVTTLGGSADLPGFAEGTGSAARFQFTEGLAADLSGTVYLAETNNNIIRKGVPLIPLDFSADRNPDIFWQNTSSGDRGFWLMNGTAFASWLDIGIVGTEWRVAAVADFNNDGKPDILWENTFTGDRGFWLMNGTTFTSWVDIGIMSTDWHIAAAADFNGDGNPDILWENTVTGDRGFWLMNGTTFSSWLDIGILTTSLRIVGATDFNADGSPDIVWENTSTGKRVIWFMHGPLFSSSFNLGIVGTDWHIAALADFNADGQPDILWENAVNGDRGFWLMNGTTFSSWVDIGVITTDWRIAP